jgi:hypothetical protein
MELTQVLNSLTDNEFNELLQKAYDRPDGEPFRIENVRVINNGKEVTIRYQTTGKTEVIEL